MMLKEFQVAPALFMKVMGRTCLTAVRARKLAAALSLNLKMQFMRACLGIQMLINQLPWRLNANAQQQNLVSTHALAPVVNPLPSMQYAYHQFHSQ
jgi:hypothetical protein